MGYRIATHPDRPASIVEVENAMSMDDVVRAHRILDEIDAAKARMRARNG